MTSTTNVQRYDFEQCRYYDNGKHIHTTSRKRGKIAAFVGGGIMAAGISVFVTGLILHMNVPLYAGLLVTTGGFGVFGFGYLLQKNAIAAAYYWAKAMQEELNPNDNESQINSYLDRRLEEYGIDQHDHYFRRLFLNELANLEGLSDQFQSIVNNNRNKIPISLRERLFSLPIISNFRF